MHVCVYVFKRQLFTKCSLTERYIVHLGQRDPFRFLSISCIHSLHRCLFTNMSSIRGTKVQYIHMHRMQLLGICCCHYCVHVEKQEKLMFLWPHSTIHCIAHRSTHIYTHKITSKQQLFDGLFAIPVEFEKDHDKLCRFLGTMHLLFIYIYQYQ